MRKGRESEISDSVAAQNRPEDNPTSHAAAGSPEMKAGSPEIKGWSKFDFCLTNHKKNKAIAKFPSQVAAVHNNTHIQVTAKSSLKAQIFMQRQSQSTRA